MEQDINWRTEMLDKLYKKLHIIFTCGIMLIISVIIGTILNNSIHLEQLNDSILFQRLSTLIIYQLENNDEYFEEIIKDYEQQYSIICVLKSDTGKIIYQSPSVFPTSTEFLLNSLRQQTKAVSSVDLNEQTITDQNGTFEIQGQNRDAYLGIPATVVTKGNVVYDLVLFHKSKTTSELLHKQATLYIVVWLASFICVAVLSRLVLMKAFKPTERILKSQKDFVASASHELKSPLAVILANVEKLEKSDNCNNDIESSVKVMDAECMRMSRLINDMLLLASSDAGTWSVSTKQINVDTLLITLYETYEPICAKHNIALEPDIADISYPTLYSDPERITQVLGIFMDNAVHHSENSSNIQIKTSLTAKTITFYVIDHGHGIAEQDKPYIFDRFYCADKSHTNKSHFGLGLSIADELSKMLNGKVGFNDTIGGGATFYITIPLK